MYEHRSGQRMALSCVFANGWRQILRTRAVALCAQIFFALKSDKAHIERDVVALHVAMSRRLDVPRG